MNMFSSIKTDGKTAEQTEFQKKISKQAMAIAMKTISGKLKVKDVDDLDKLYKAYFKKYPDIEKEINANDRIKKLRSIV